VAQSQAPASPQYECAAAGSLTPRLLSECVSLARSLAVVVTLSIYSKIGAREIW